MRSGQGLPSEVRLKHHRRQVRNFQVCAGQEIRMIPSVQSSDLILIWLLGALFVFLSRHFCWCLARTDELDVQRLLQFPLRANCFISGLH